MGILVFEDNWLKTKNLRVKPDLYSIFWRQEYAKFFFKYGVTNASGNNQSEWSHLGSSFETTLGKNREFQNKFTSNQLYLEVETFEILRWSFRIIYTRIFTLIHKVSHFPPWECPFNSSVLRNEENESLRKMKLTEYSLKNKYYWRTCVFFPLQS